MKKTLQYLALVVALLAGWWILNNQYTISDWFALRGYTAPDYVVGYADDTAMSDYGRKIFYVAKPELDQKETFNTNCPIPDRSLVLGCYSNGAIYVFDVQDERLDGVEEVTAAHEMLHAAYTRLGGSDERDLNTLLDEQLAEITDTRVLELVEQYRRDDPDSVYNEMHSIFGTEVKELIPALEEHYVEYFADRSQVVAISDSYEQVFVDIDNKIKNLEQEISALKTQIDTQETSINGLQVTIDAESSRLENLRSSGDIPGYNSGVPAFNALVANYNSQVDNYKNLIDKHNRKVDERNLQATTQNELVQSLDSKFEKL